MRTSWFVPGIAGLLCVLLAGCATNRSEVSLGATPAAPIQLPAASGRPIVIKSVVDARSFAAAPRDPSVPSLGFEGSVAATAEVKARAIGRKRNTYGMALGDVLLESGETVEGAVRRELAAALAEAGYQVVPAPGPQGTPAVDVRIDDFWSWINPGFWSITIGSKITTQLGFDAQRSPMVVSVSGADSTLAATDSTWIESLRKTLARYRAEIVRRKAELP